MKRKLRLLLTMVLATTMVMGMNLTVLADAQRPEGCPESVTPCKHPEADHTMWLYYVYKIPDDGPVKVACYKCDGSYLSLASVNVSDFGDTPTLNKVYHKTSADGKYYYCASNPPAPSPSPAPTPKKESKKEKEQKEGISYLEYLAMLAANESDKDVAVEKELRAANATVDKDTFKSEAPSKTVMSTDTMGADKFFDLKVHAADDTTKANQNFLAQRLIGPNVQILLTENIYSGRDLSISENGSLQTLTWNNLPKNQAGAVHAVVYNQTDKAYVINGMLDANGVATFTGFKLRPASTITICK